MILTTDAIRTEDLPAISRFCESKVLNLWNPEQPEACNFVIDVNCTVRAELVARVAGTPGTGIIDLREMNLTGRTELKALAGKLRTEATAEGNAPSAELFARIENTLESEAASRNELDRIFGLD